MKDVMEFPDGSVYVVTKRPGNPARDPVEMEITFAANSFAPPPHVHPRQVEEYEVLDGEMEVRIGDERRTLRRGDSAAAPAGAVHTFAPGPAGARFRNVHDPALEFEDMIASLHRLAEAGILTNPKSPKTLIYVAMAWRRYPETIVPAGPLRAAMVALAGLGRLFGWSVDAPRK